MTQPAICPECNGTGEVTHNEEGCFTGGVDEDGAGIGWYEEIPGPCPMCRPEAPGNGEEGEKK